MNYQPILKPESISCKLNKNELLLKSKKAELIKSKPSTADSKRLFETETKRTVNWPNTPKCIITLRNTSKIQSKDLSTAKEAKEALSKH